MVMTISVVIGSISILVPGFLDTTDVIVSNYLLVIGGLLIAIFVGWIWGTENFLNAIHVENKALRTWLGLSVKYLCLVAILVIFLGNFI